MRRGKTEDRSFAPTVTLLPGDRWHEALDALQRADLRRIEAYLSGNDAIIEMAETAYEGAVASAQVLFGASP